MSAILFTLMSFFLAPHGAPMFGGVIYHEGTMLVEAQTCAEADVQAAVTAASNGATVLVPAGSCTWEGAYPDYILEWTNKNITLQGAGIGNTVISCGVITSISPQGGRCLRWNSTSANNTFSQSRITGFTFRITANGGQAIIVLDQESITTPHSGWRIDHNRFWYDASFTGNAVTIQGSTYGVIDHNVFDWKAQGINIQVTSAQSYESGMNLPGQFMWQQAADLGTANFLFIEDNQFNHITTTGIRNAIYDTAGGGGRTVIRYNTINSGFFNHHWVRGNGTTSGDWCGTLLEVYRNVFVGAVEHNATTVGGLEAGTGVFYENQVTGYTSGFSLTDRRAAGTETAAPLGDCDGTETHDGNAGDASAPGWPCLGQIGRSPGKTIAQIQGGDKQTSLPSHFWKNGTDAGCATGGSCTDSIGVSVNPAAYIKATAHDTGGGFGHGDVDYILGGDTPKSGYTAYTYPHPLITAQDGLVGAGSRINLRLRGDQ
jgi:hypothetical protein